MTKLKELRQAKGLSRSELARLSGMSLRTLEAYEQGLRDIGKASYESVILIAEALDIDPKELFTK